MGVDLNDVRTSRMPDGNDSNGGWTIVRASADSPRKFVCLSDDIFGIRTHFYHGRTGPCLKEGCHCVASGQLSRWKGYLLVVEPSTKSQCILEFTPGCATALDSARQEHGTMRGLQLHVTRSGKRANSKVVITVRGIVHLGPSALADVPVWPIISKIWQLNSDFKAEEQGHGPDDLSDYERAA